MKEIGVHGKMNFQHALSLVEVEIKPESENALIHYQAVQQKTVQILKAVVLKQFLAILMLVRKLKLIYILITQMRLESYFLILLYLFSGPGSWGEWSGYFECNLSCGGGNKSRVRECIDSTSGNAADNCPNFESGGVDTVPCNTPACKNV